MGRIDFFLGVFLLVFASPLRSPALWLSPVLETNSFALTGSVFSDDNNERISNADLILCDDGGTPLQQSHATESGEFAFQGLRPARYILRVSAVGYQSAELHIDLSFTSERGLAVSLKPLHSTPTAPPSGITVSAHELSISQVARDLLASGKQKLYAENNPQAALHEFQSAAAQSPGYFEAFYQTGMAYLALQNPAEAEKQFRKSTELSQKKYADADIALGTLLLHRGEIKEGEPLLRQGLASNPRSWPGQFELGELELSRDHLELALAAAEIAARLAPQQPTVYRLLAIIYLRQKNFPALIPALDSYIRLDPDSAAGKRARELRVQAEKQLANSSGTAVAIK
jgi:tetratricopeptide (TPR) repeat protein